MTALWLRVLWISATTSVVLLPLLLCAGTIRRRYRAGTGYVLWLLLCLRLLVPAELTFSRPVVTVELPDGVMHVPVEQVQLTGPAVSAAAPSAEGGLSLAEVTAWVWSVGVGSVLLWHGVVYGSVRRRLWKNAFREPEDQTALEEMGGHVPVLRTTVDTPMTLGLLRPVIYLPEEVPEEDLPLILQHELCHLCRKDLWYKGLLLVCSAVHWFNPLVWRLSRVAGDNLEFCCDETVVAGQDDSFRRHYGNVLLHSAAGQGSVLSTSLGSGDLKGRIMNLFVRKKNGMVLVCAAAAAAVLMGSLVGCDTESAVSAVEKEPVQMEQVPELAQELATPSESTEDWLWPLEEEYQVSALYGERTHPITGQVSNHTGLDIVAEADTPVLAAQSGTVLQSEFDAELGNYVLVAHKDDRQSLYACLKRVDVETGETVEQGQTIGTVGQTGQATGPHLHIEVRDSEGGYYDPMAYYPDVEWTVK